MVQLHTKPNSSLSSWDWDTYEFSKKHPSKWCPLGMSMKKGHTAGTAGCLASRQGLNTSRWWGAPRRGAMIEGGGMEWIGNFTANVVFFEIFLAENLRMIPPLLEKGEASIQTNPSNFWGASCCFCFFMFFLGVSGSFLLDDVWMMSPWFGVSVPSSWDQIHDCYNLSNMST